MEAKFFNSQAAFRRWLEKNHDKRTELLVGFHKKSAGKQTLSYPEALDETLCFGWIDGVRKSLNNDSYTIRFTPRKPKSIWSRVNVQHVERLKKSGRMHASGLRAYTLRDDKRTGIYSFENLPREFSEEYLKRFQSKSKAWQFFEAQPPSYKKTAIYWVMSAKQVQTQLRRLDQLIENSAQGIRDRVVSGKTAVRVGWKPK